MGLKNLLLCTLATVAYNATAQHMPANDTTIKGQTIEIIQSYKPQVKQAPKPGWIPQLPPPDTSRRALNYDVPRQTLYYTYNSLPLRPLALVGDSAKPPFADYVKLGAGNLSTVYVDAGIGSISGKDYETAIHLHHNSQAGTLPDQQTALSGLEAEGHLHRDHSEWHATLEGERNQYNYYGYNHDLYKYGSDSLKQVYGLARVKVDMDHKADSGSRWNYHPDANASFYNGKWNTSETSFGINAPFSYRIDSNLSMPIGVSAIVTNYNSGNISTGNNIAAITGGLDVSQRPGLDGHILASLALGKGGNAYLLPDLLASYTVPGTIFSIKAGWLATLRQNTYEQLTAENPYLFHIYEPVQTRRDEVFGDIQAGLGSHFTLNGRVSWWDFNDMATFVNNIGDQKQFYVDYINTNAVSFHLALRYKIAEIWSLGASGDLYNFFGSGSDKVYAWGEPDTKLKGDLMIMPFPKLVVTGYLSLMNGIYEPDQTNKPIKMDMITDLGGNAEYQVLKRLNVFVQLNNLLNEKYQRWYGYQSYGLNLYGGIRLKF